MTRISHSGGAGTRARAAFRSSVDRAVEPLERRVLLSTFVVVNTADSGPGSLRQAILSANATPGSDTIAFNIPGVGVQTIAPLSPLPAVTDTVTVDGTTQPGYSAAAGAPVIELSGANAGAGASGLVLGGAERSIVKGLIINRFAADGIVVEGTSDQIKGCYIGLDALGDAASPNGGNGVTVLAGQAAIGGSTTADRNVISGNRLAGIDDLAPGAVISGNYIGINAIGSAAVGNGHEGVYSLGNVTIGAAEAQGNVISGNGSSGIYVTALGSVQIAGNRIGTDASGTVALGNGTSTAAIYRDGITAIGAGVAGNSFLSIGLAAVGATPSIGNVISGNKGNGISITGTGNDAGLQIVSNRIGTDVSGNSSLGNAGNGLLLGLSPIGFSSAITANLISGNGADGILLQNQYGGSLTGNNIGTNQSGTAAIPNATNGIEAHGGATIGVDTARGNIISGNGGNGIVASGSVRIVNNLIGTDATGNVGLGNHGNGILILAGSRSGIVSIAPWRQVISANGAAGISIQGSVGNTIAGNFIGTDLAGDAPLGNGGNGIEDFDSGDNIQQNEISANARSGVYLGPNPSATAPTLGAQVLLNQIGTDRNGMLVPGLGNARDGITIFRSSNNVIGGSGVHNVIAGNGGNGVTVDAGGITAGGAAPGTVAVHNRISQNSIFSNAGLGIDLGNDGVNPIIPLTPPHVGPNLLENPPVILSAVSFPMFTFVRVQLVESTATTVELFTNDAADPSGFGEGQSFAGLGQVNGNQGTIQLPPLSVGTIITATATDTAGNTSEFSRAVATIAPPPIVERSAFDPQTNTIGFMFNKDVSASLSLSAVRVHNQTTGQDVAVTGVSYDHSTNTATLQLPGSLPGGTYLVTLLARAVTDASGVQLDGNNDGTPGDDYTFTFTSVSGDVNLDGAVSFDDLLILASHFGQTGTFAEGDLNHDGTIDFADLLELAQHYNH